MPDSDPTHDNPRNTRNLPAVVPSGEVGRPAADHWLIRAIRTLFGWKAGSVRDDLQVVLDASTPDDVGFSAVERTMLRNILGLHERRLADVMVHRADIVAVKRDITLGELLVLFESAAHSRLVVYNETLDDPEGMVHIRDLLAFMTASSASPTSASTASAAAAIARWITASASGSSCQQSATTRTSVMGRAECGIVQSILCDRKSRPARRRRECSCISVAARLRRRRRFELPVHDGSHLQR